MGGIEDFQQTLDKFHAPAEEQAELKAIVNSTRSDIEVESAPSVLRGGKIRRGDSVRLA